MCRYCAVIVVFAASILLVLALILLAVPPELADHSSQAVTNQGSYPENPVIIPDLVRMLIVAEAGHHCSTKRASRVDGAAVNGNEHRVGEEHSKADSKRSDHTATNAIFVHC